jgi:hypothetical protein
MGAESKLAWSDDEKCMKSNSSFFKKCIHLSVALYRVMSQVMNGHEMYTFPTFSFEKKVNFTLTNRHRRRRCRRGIAPNSI